MYIFKNALKTISRSKGRNILIGIIVVVIAISSCVALSINHSATQTEKQGLESLTITAQISLDRQALMSKAQQSGEDMRKFMQDYQSLSLDELSTYAKSTYVKDFYYTLTSSINASGELEPFDTSDSEDGNTDENSQQNIPQMPGGGMGQGKGGDIPGGMGNQGDFTITGYSSQNSMTAFTTGTSYISDGEVFDTASDKMVCIISDELATLNELKVNDTIKLANPNQEDEIYPFTIVGIYHNESTANSPQGGMRFSTSNDPANQIYVSYSTLKKVVDESSTKAVVETDDDTGRQSTTALRDQLSGTYVFTDIENFEAFQTDIKNMGLSEYYTASSSDINNYEQSLLPIKNLSKFAAYFLIIVLAIGGIILIVLNIFNIRERKYEVGVLTAIGMKKIKVASQFITEIFVVTFICIIIGTAVGAVISVPTANALLESQITSQQTQQQQQMQNFGKGGGPGGNEVPSRYKGGMMGGGNPFNFTGQQVANYITEINASTNLVVVMQLMGIGIILTLLSSCSAVAFILRYEPLKILSNRA